MRRAGHAPASLGTDSAQLDGLALMDDSTRHPYSCPQYYDLAWGQGLSTESRFFQRCFERHATGRRVRRVLEPACGTGRLLLLFARSGFRVHGVDLDRDSVEYCNARFRRNGLPSPAVVGDMTELAPKAPVDAIIVTNNSFRHLMSETAARRHLASAAKALRPGGLYIAGLHLLPGEGVRLTHESWTGARGKLRVRSRVWASDLNRAARREQVEVALDIRSGKRKFTLDGSIALRTYTAKQIRTTLGAAPGLRVVAAYDFRFDDPISVDSSTQDVIFVLRKE